MRRAARLSAAAADTPGAALVAIGSTASSNSSDIAVSCGSSRGTGARRARSGVRELYLASSHGDDGAVVTPACDSDADRRAFAGLVSARGRGERRAPGVNGRRAGDSAGTVVALLPAGARVLQPVVASAQCLESCSMSSSRRSLHPFPPCAARRARVVMAAPRRCCAWASAPFRNASPRHARAAGASWLLPPAPTSSMSSACRSVTGVRRHCGPDPWRRRHADLRNFLGTPASARRLFACRVDAARRDRPAPLGAGACRRTCHSS